ncbi:hypothetical protein G9A89_015380 [Geosiphon pyriformis]|nr:hypothetical protein G9A89_015380 [Geosiphon pyriformis]
MDFTSPEQKVTALPPLSLNPQEMKSKITSEAPATSTHSLGRRKTDGLKDVVFGSIAGMTGKLVEYPFDTIKVRLQSQSPEQPTFKGPLDCFRQTLQHEGFLGLYRGLSSPMVGAMLENAMLFVAYNHIQMLIHEYTNPHYDRQKPYEKDSEKPSLELYQLCIAGGLAGGLASLLLTPIELVKCKLQVQETLNYNANNIEAKSTFSHSEPVHTTGGSGIYNSAKPGIYLSAAKNPNFNGPYSVIKHTFKNNGVVGFFRGLFPTLVRESIGGSVWFGTYEYITRLFIQQKQNNLGSNVVVTKSDLNPMQLMTAGAFAGMGYNFSAFPADSIKSVMQTEEEMMLAAAQRVNKRSFFQIGRDLYKADGIRVFYRGCGITVARAAPSSGIIFMTYESLSRRFS